MAITRPQSHATATRFLKDIDVDIEFFLKAEYHQGGGTAYNKTVL
jgi:hypothetical protein